MNASTGALTEVNGSPFNAGLIPQQLLVDPTGRFVYVINKQSEDITALSVDPSTGALTELPGSPFSFAATPLTAGVDPTGRFLYVFALNPTASTNYEYLYEYTIDSVTGILTPVSSSPTIWEYGQGYSVVSIAFDPAGNYAYLGQVAGGNLGALTLVCSIDFSTGTLTEIGAVQPAATGQADQIAVSPNGNFLYSVNTMFSQADAFTIGSGTGALNEVAGSPFSIPYGPSSLVVHPSGNFLYVTNSNSTFQSPPPNGPVYGSVYAFSINSGTGALTPLPHSPYTTGVDPLSVVVDPTGSFAYWTSTKNTTGTPFAQIVGNFIGASSGALTPLATSPWTDTATSEGAQLAISYGPSTTPNPSPMISSLSPPSTTAIAVPFTLQVNGSGFVPGATVYFEGQARTTTYVSSSQLNASILGSDIDNSGTAVVFVFNPLPGGGASTSVEFSVSAPVPVIDTINPSNVLAGAPTFALFTVGSGFITSSVINFNGMALSTNYSSPTVIFAEITAAQIAAQGTATISVTNPGNGIVGGGTSGSALLSILPPNTQPVVSSISPTSATAGGPAFALTVNGSGFVQGSQVSFNLNNVTTTFVSSSQLTAAIPASAIAIAGNPYVIVTNPDGYVSTFVTFVVSSGLESLSPPSVPAGSNALLLSVIGTGFAPASTVLVNGSPRATAYVNSTLLQATLLSSDLAQSGTLIITVMDPPPGGGAEGTLSLIVTGYKVSASSPSQTVSAGATANYSLTLTPTNGTVGNSVVFSASGLPSGATWSFLPSQTIAAGSGTSEVTLAISTTSGSTSSIVIPRPPALRSSADRDAGAVLLFLCALLLPFILRQWRALSEIARAWRGRQPARSLGAMAMMLICVTAGICGFQQGCSTSATPAASSVLTPVNIAGNWIFTATSSSSVPITIAGLVTQNGSTFSGSMSISGSPCALTGSLSGTMTGNVITASLVENETDATQTISLTGAVSSDGNLASGNYAAPAGGCTNGDAGTWSGTWTQMAPVNIAGNWTFSTTSSDYPVQTAVTGTVTQSGPIFSGSMNISGTPCALTGSLSGTMTGDAISAFLAENEVDNTQTISLTGTVSSDGNSASGSYSAPAGGCTNGDAGTWSGTRSVSNANATPAGTYQITVSATSGNATINTTVTLTVM